MLGWLAERRLRRNGSGARGNEIPVLFAVGALVPVLALLAPAPALALTWFVVAENPALGACVHCDSYVLPLEDPGAIAHARELVASGGTAEAPIVLAEIVAGADGTNRNVIVIGEPPWSWHVSAFQGFVDLTAEIYDGWPGFVESDVEGWIANTRTAPGEPGVVGFWNYTVVAELPEPGPLAASAAVACALALLRRARLRPAKASVAIPAPTSTSVPGSGTKDSSVMVTVEMLARLPRTPRLTTVGLTSVSTPRPRAVRPSAPVLVTVCGMPVQAPIRVSMPS
jgi:hypothetical protein